MLTVLRTDFSKLLPSPLCPQFTPGGHTVSNTVVFYSGCTFVGVVARRYMKNSMYNTHIYTVENVKDVSPSVCFQLCLDSLSDTHSSLVSLPLSASPPATEALAIRRPS